MTFGTTRESRPAAVGARTPAKGPEGPRASTASEPSAQPEPSAHEKPSLEDLYAEHFDFVWRSLRRLGVLPSALDDATQDVFIVVHRKLGGFEARCSLRAWLFAIVRRVASDYRRTVSRKGGLAPLPPDVAASSASDPHALAVREQAARIVHEFLGTLDDDRRAAFVLGELEQMSAPEISVALETNPSTVYSRIASARKAFVAFLQERYPSEIGGGDG